MLELDANELERLGGCLEQWRLQPGERVLEPGCGAGRFTEWIARNVGEEGQVIAFDLSVAMLERASCRELPSSVTLLQATATALPVASESIDRVLCINVFPHFSEPREVLDEFARVLQPGGELWIQHFMASGELNALHRRLDPPVCHHLLPPIEQTESLLGEAGFVAKHGRDDADGYQVCAVRARRGGMLPPDAVRRDSRGQPFDHQL